MQPSSTQHTADNKKTRKHVFLNRFLVAKTLLFFRRAVPFGEWDAGWHQLREVTGADTSKKKGLPWFKYQHLQLHCHRKKTRPVQYQSSPWMVKALEKDGSWVKIENSFILTWTRRRELTGECIPPKVFAQISEHAASPIELRARTEQHFPAITAGTN